MIALAREGDNGDVPGQPFLLREALLEVGMDEGPGGREVVAPDRGANERICLADQHLLQLRGSP